MALIGTISGSNRTSTTAISGSLIIADEPGSRFPSLAGGVKLFVSGAKTQLGSDSPMAVFGGDTFVSGAFGTDSYIQMKPVGTLRVPTNTTASYIYTSGSTNDLYFTQYQPGTGFTNTTRLRWIEASLQTGLQFGGVISSTSGSTTYNISSGSGLIVTQNASLTDDPYPTIVHVNWGNLSSLPLPSIGTTQITYIAMDSTATPYLKSTPFVDGDYENYIVLGRVLHTDKAGTNGAINQPQVSFGTSQFRGDFVRAFGPIKISGHTLYVSGTTGLKKDAGDSYAEGRNYSVNPSSPNYISSTSDTAQNTSKIFYEYVNADGDDVIINNGNVGYTAVDFENYNNSGTLTTVGAGNKFTIQRVYWFPNSANRAFFVYYGNEIYATIADAQAGIATEVFTEGKNTRDAAIFLGYVIVKGTGLNFADPTTYKVIQAGSFRAVASSGAGATGSPGGADTYVQFNDAGVFSGTNDFRFIKSSGSALVANLFVTGTNPGALTSSGSIIVKDQTGVIKTTINVDGSVTGSSLLLTSGLTVTGSGVFEANTSTPALRITQQGSGNAITVEDSANPDASPFVVTADGRVGIGSTAPSSYVFITGSDTTIPLLTIRSADAAVDTLVVTSSAAAGGNVGIITVNQGNLANKRSINITNIGGGTSGLRMEGSGLGSIAFDNFNASPQITAGNKNLWFNTNGSAYDTTQISYRFTEVNKTPTYPNQKTFLITGNTNGFKTGSYFEVEKSGSIKLLELQGDVANNSLFVSGSLLLTGSAFINGDLAVDGGNITSKQASPSLYSTSNGIVTIGSSISTGTIAGDLGVAGRATLGGVGERLVHSQSVGNTLNFSLIQQGVFYINNPTATITANFINVPTNTNRVYTPTIIVSQSGTPQQITAVQIDSVGQTINWSNGVIPAANAGKQDVFGFSLIRTGSDWKVLGQLSTYG